MLDQVDLGQKLAKDEYKQQMDRLAIQLGELHRKIHELAIPAVIVFEGWDAVAAGLRHADGATWLAVAWQA